jgi:hypothetical protein
MTSFKQFLECQLITEDIQTVQESMPDLMKIINAGIKETLTKVTKLVKDWGYKHLSQYEADGMGDIIRKIINNPEVVTKQLMAVAMTKELGDAKVVHSNRGTSDFSDDLPVLK